MKSVGLNKF